MIKTIMFLIIFFSLSAIVYTDENAFLEVHGLLKGGVNKNLDLIEAKSASLSPSEKLFLLDVHKKDSGIPFVVNLLSGFGIGSYIQGDISGGTIQLSGQLLGLVGLVAGIGMSAKVEDHSSSYYGYGRDYYANEITSLGKGFMITGVILFYGMRLYGYISPFIFKNIYNGKLRAALQ